MKAVLGALASISFAFSGTAFAEGKGCQAFKWPIAREQALLATAPSAVSGAMLDIGRAVVLDLQPAAAVGYEVPPERRPKPGTYGGTVRTAVPQDEQIRVTLSGDSWVDVVQKGHLVRSADFSGATGCPGVRKSVRFAVAGGDITIQISGAPAARMGIALLAE
jgi:hypothetical protein